MTFDQIVQRVLNRLNLDGDTAKARIGDYVNDRYKQLTSSVGLQTSRRITTDVTRDGSVISSENPLPEVVLDGIEKVMKITIQFGTEALRVLDELTYDEITNVPVTPSRSPMAFAVKGMGPQTVTIVLDSFPDDEFTLTVEGYDIADLLSDNAQPNFPESFHDILVEGAISDELRKMEKPQLAAIAEQKYEARSSSLRLFIAISGYLDIYQGKDQRNRRWGKTWYDRGGWGG